MTTTTNPPIHLPIPSLRADARYQPRVRGVDEKHIKLLLASDPATWPA